MNPMKLYRLLQSAVGRLNDLVVGLYNDTITAEEAEARAMTIIEETLAAIRPQG